MGVVCYNDGEILFNQRRLRMTHIEILTHEKKLRSGAYPTLAVAGKLIRNLKVNYRA